MRQSAASPASAECTAIGPHRTQDVVPWGVEWGRNFWTHCRHTAVRQLAGRTWDGLCECLDHVVFPLWDVDGVILDHDSARGELGHTARHGTARQSTAQHSMGSGICRPVELCNWSLARLWHQQALSEHSSECGSLIDWFAYILIASGLCAEHINTTNPAPSRTQSLTPH